MSTDPIAPIIGDPPAAALPGLSNRRELAFAAIERTRMPMVVADATLPDSPIVLANRAFLKMSGYSADEVIGRNCRFMQGPETDQAAVQRIRDGLKKRTEEFTVELLNYRKDGSTFWNQLFISPICDEAGELRYLFASQFDVTTEHESSRLEANERRLMREIDHRAKNALALVQGIVRLSKADNVEDYAEAVQGRVDALAQAHLILSEAGWKAVPIGRLVAVAVAPFVSPQVRVDGPAIDVAAEQVQPLALLLRELIANAAEHGALSAEAGSMSIDWRRDDGQTIVRLHETGGPPPAVERTPGFGLTIVDRFMRRQLGGEVAFDWRDTGLETVLTLPIAAKWQ